MNRFFRLAFFAALPLAPLNFTSQAGAKPSRKASTSTPRTVSDYFKLLPDKYTHGKAAQLLSNNYARIDRANDYMEASLGPGAPELTVALFRHAGRVVVAVEVFDHDTEGISFSLLRRENGRWKNVTRSLIPLWSPHNHYEIPQHGTTMRVYRQVRAGDEEYLYDLVWRNGRFRIP